MNTVRPSGYFASNVLLKLKTDTKQIRLIKWFFIFTGIWKSESNQQHNSLVAYLHLVILLLAFGSISYKFILKYDDIDINTEILLHFVEIFHSICAIIMLIIKRKRIARLAEFLNYTVDFSKLPIENEEKCKMMLTKEFDSLMKVIKLAFGGIIFVYISVIIDSNALCLSGTRQRKLLYPSWFPFSTDSADDVVLYYLAVAFELLIYVELVCIDLATAGIWYGTINTVSGIFAILGHCFQNLGNSEPLVSLEGTAEREGKIKNLIGLHNFIFR